MQNETLTKLLRVPSTSTKPLGKMLLFCPWCCNMLLAENVGNTRFFCQTCPYVQGVTRRVAIKVKNLPRKERGDVIDVDAFVNGAPQIRVQPGCPKCNHEMACYRQLQIRSADEPMTTFYCCVACSHQWKDNG